MTAMKGEQFKKKKYTVGVREVHVRYYSVKARSPDEAKALVDNHRETAKDCEELEFSHELGHDTWSIEETP